MNLQDKCETVRKKKTKQHQILFALQLKETHSDKSIPQCHVVNPPNRPEKLSKEASLQ